MIKLSMKLRCNLYGLELEFFFFNIENYYINGLECF